MKTLSVLFLLFAFATSIFAGQDSLFVEMKDDTVKIWNTSVYINCCCSLRFDVSIALDSITIIQLDTAKSWCRCICPFDLVTSITGLTAGTYFVSVYRYLPLGDSMFVGSISFTIQNPIITTNSIAGYQSECKGAVFVTDDEPNVPTQFTIWQNYPNPFNPSTVIRYNIPENSHVKLSVFNILGREVTILVNEDKKVGRYEAVWDAADFPSGVYFYRLKIGNQIKTGKMSLIR